MVCGLARPAPTRYLAPSLHHLYSQILQFYLFITITGRVWAPGHRWPSAHTAAAHISSTTRSRSSPFRWRWWITPRLVPPTWPTGGRRLWLVARLRTPAGRQTSSLCSHTIISGQIGGTDSPTYLTIEHLVASIFASVAHRRTHAALAVVVWPSGTRITNHTIDTASINTADSYRTLRVEAIAAQRRAVRLAAAAARVRGDLAHLVWFVIGHLFAKQPGKQRGCAQALNPNTSRAGNL